MSSIERVSVRVRGSFDPGLDAHVQRVIAGVEQEKGPGWTLAYYDTSAGSVLLERRSAATAVTATDGRSRTLALDRSYGPGDGERAAARFEAQPDNAGYTMTRYDAYAGTATLTRLTRPEIHARDRIASALGVKPWEVQVSVRDAGGFHIGLPQSYAPSRHDVKLQEAITTSIGRDGWYARIDVPNLRAEIIPSAPPTFPAAVPYPFAEAAQLSGMDRLLFGMSLPPTGDADGELLWLDFNSGPHSAVNGTTGAGKTAVVNSIISSGMHAGMELVICDVPHKAVDYSWLRPFVRDHGWGCESLEDSYVALELVYEEGHRRAQLLKAAGVEKLSLLPPNVQQQTPPIIVIVDELSGLLQKTPELKSLPRDHPKRVDAEQENILHDLILNTVVKICAELRFVGIRVILSTQVANATTGIPPKLRTLLSNKLLLGVNQNDANRRQVFNDADAVPLIPAHLRADKTAGRGVGTCEMEGQSSHVFKGLYGDVREHAAALERLGRRRTLSPEPTDAQRRRIASFLYLDEEEDVAFDGVRGRGADAWSQETDTGKQLAGFAKANAARAALGATPDGPEDLPGGEWMAKFRRQPNA